MKKERKMKENLPSTKFKMFYINKSTMYVRYLCSFLKKKTVSAGLNLLATESHPSLFETGPYRLTVP